MNKIILLLCLFKYVELQKLNVCKNFVDYIMMTPTNCWYSEEIAMTTPEIIKHQGYPLEIHEVTTADNYILTVFRIPKENPKGVVFVQHPLLSSSVGWVDKGKKDSLGFILSDAGYDVWLGNYRGNLHSRKHTYLTPNEYQFWNFSFHEHGLYDVPAQLDFVKNITNSKPGSITYIGHSMGATGGIIYASHHVEHAQCLKVMVLLAPATIIRNITSVWSLFTPYIDDLYQWGMDTKLYEFAGYNSPIQSITSMCKTMPTMFLCMIFDIITLETIDELPAEWYPMKYGHNPGGTSIKTVMHYAQIYRDGGPFKKFDYGKEKNLEYYHLETPPLYDVEKIAVPFYVMIGDQDKVAMPNDAYEFYDKLPARVKIYGPPILIDHFNHASFLYGKNARQKNYLPLVTFINKLYDNYYVFYYLRTSVKGVY